jgi:3-hydroxyisobutyrate dehydrogenase-like beta-hydroxyacid dehydrogenase
MSYLSAWLQIHIKQTRCSLIKTLAPFEVHRLALAVKSLSCANIGAALPVNATIILCSTVPAAYLHEVQARLVELDRTDLFLIDSPVSGGTIRAAQGTLTILASGSSLALTRGSQILSDLSEKLYIIPGGIGAASNVKMINQLLAGVHIAAAAEAMGLAAKAGLNTREVYDIITHAAGSSWMFENRVPHMLDDDWRPHSAVDIFVKDMVSYDPFF